MPDLPSPERLSLVAAEGTTAPPDVIVEWLKTGDGAILRTARWMNPVAPVRGTVLLCHGRTEFIEKYLEVVAELLARGYCVATFDWRGQGLSSRSLNDPLKGHVQDFSQFDQDLALFMENIALRKCPGPIIGLAHSMGGNILLRFLHDYPGAVTKAVLTAPMLAIKTGAFSPALARAIAVFQRHVGGSESYIWGGGPNTWQAPFAGNTVTSDLRRFQRCEALLAAEPRLRLASPTFQWLDAAFRAMALVRSDEFAAQIKTPVLLIGAAHDKIVHPGADMRLIRRLSQGCFVLLQAEHEIMMERDEIRSLFWGFFDSFVAAAC